MADKHNMLNSAPEQQKSENDFVKMADEMPDFDKHMAEMSAESEKNPLNLESLKSVAGFSEQLEKMGANQEIISNPAFKRVLEGVLSESGLKFGADLEGSDNAKGNELRLACQLDKKRGKDGSRHDRSNFRINVREDGNFTIDYAYIDRESRMMDRGTFANAKLPPNAETVEAYDDTNVASRLNFIKYKNSGGFEINARRSYEDQSVPVTDSKNVFVGVHSNLMSESNRGFNADGVEEHRRDIYYEELASDHLNGLAAHIEPKQDWGEPEMPSRASFNAIDHFMYNEYRHMGEVKSSVYYSRNPDGETVKIEGHDRDGKFGAESVRLNNEHGTDDIKVSARIEDLRADSAY